VRPLDQGRLLLCEAVSGLASWWSSAFSANIYLESGVPALLTKIQEMHSSDAGQVDFCDATAKYRTEFLLLDWITGEFNAKRQGPGSCPPPQSPIFFSQCQQVVPAASSHPVHP
jgi:hypothetical protein